jgi:chromosome partitioning protein
VRVVAVVNQKGGSGKTTLAVNLAAALAEVGEPVLLLDIDPQGSASRWLGASGDGAADVFAGADLEAAAEPSNVAGVDVIGSGMALAAAVRHAPPHAVNALRRAVQRAPERWRFVILDCPPSLDVLSVAGLLAASEAVVPVDASGLTLAVLGNLFDTMAEVRAQTGALAVAGIVASRVDERQRLTRDVLAALREAYGAQVFASMIRDRVAFREAATLGRPVIEHEPQGDAAADVRAVASELRERKP